MATIAFIGNFEVPFSTESELRWTLEEKLGHRVLKLQENKVTTDEVVSSVRDYNASLLLWVKTHGWSMPGDAQQMLDRIRKFGVKSCSFHLDRYWGLNVADGRENRIGNDPFFKTDVFFSADGGNDEKFRERGVNHVWLPPGVVERDCYFGKPSPQWGNQVVFCGADGYHSEYPFRPMLVNRLREIYGSNFRLYQGIRQQALNDLYATARVVVGDSCFAGADRYWSDRVPETIGRGGFLIYPETPGLEIPGLVTYKPQNIADLVTKINYFLDDEHRSDRIARRNEAQAFVKENHTYTNRMKTLLDFMGVK